MLINRNNNETKHVNFVSYTGSWPNLCSGVLTLEIDGKKLHLAMVSTLKMNRNTIRFGAAVAV